MDTQEKEKKIKLMRFWLFGLFVIVFAAFTIYFGMFFEAVGTSLLARPQYWVAVILSAVVCVGGFYFYKWYLGRK